MAHKTIGLPDDLHAYVVAHAGPPDPLIDTLRVQTAQQFPDVAHFQIAPEQVRFLTILTKLLGVRTAVEVGTFTGLSALAIARGLPPGGKLICCDVSEQFTALAQQVWRRAGVADQVELRIGPAATTLAAMPVQPHIDLAFIDADKTSYQTYWDLLVPRVRSGGTILVDNVLRGGRILAPETDDDRAMVPFNEAVLADSRVEATMLPFADGITFARKI